MARIDYVSPDEASDRITDLLRDYSDEHGERSMMRSSLANHPPLLEACVYFFEKAFREGNLDRELKEVVAVAVSQENGCDYCASSHRESLIEVFGLPEDRVDLVREEEYEGLPNQYRVAVEFATQAARDPHRITDEEFEQVLEAGFTEQDVVELLGVVGLFMFVNTYGITMDMQAADRDEKLTQY